MKALISFVVHPYKYRPMSVSEYICADMEGCLHQWQWLSAFRQFMGCQQIYTPV